MSTTKRWGVFTGFLGGAKSYTVTYETDSRSDWDVEVRAERFRRAALPGRFFNRATGGCRLDYFRCGIRQSISALK